MANKNATIKGATDKELDDLLRRLRKESDVQRLILTLRARSIGDSEYDSNVAVSTTAPIDSLYHYGILGMKWGKRKNGKGKVQRKIKTKAEINAEIKKMSDADLRTRLNRMQMEKQYKELTKPQLTAGEKMVKEFMVSSGKQLATAYVAKKIQKKLAGS